MFLHVDKELEKKRKKKESYALKNKIPTHVQGVSVCIK